VWQIVELCHMLGGSGHPIAHARPTRLSTKSSKPSTLPVSSCKAMAFRPASATRLTTFSASGVVGEDRVDASLDEAQYGVAAEAATATRENRDLSILRLHHFLSAFRAPD